MAEPSTTAEAPSSPGSVPDKTQMDQTKQFELTVKFGPENYSESVSLKSGTTFEEILIDYYEKWPAYDFDKAKAMVARRQPGLTKTFLKTPEDDDFELDVLAGNTLRFMVPKISDLQSLQGAAADAQAKIAARQERRRARRRAAMAAEPHRPRGSTRPSGVQTLGDSSQQYTFLRLEPLRFLPNPARSLQFLERLRDDPGIRHTMRKHKWTVPLLTEMDPTMHTQSSHEGTTRTLGLNRNKGEVIELRLRTDAYDGYRDYKTIRKTLCHELAHNVHTDHDRKFWDLCHQIEREVAQQTDFGRTVGDEELAPERGGEDEDVADHGGWEGGTYVLGGGSGPAGSSSAPISRDQVLAARRRWLERLGTPTQTPVEQGAPQVASPKPAPAEPNARLAERSRRHRETEDGGNAEEGKGASGQDGSA